MTSFQLSGKKKWEIKQSLARGILGSQKPLLISRIKTEEADLADLEAAGRNSQVQWPRNW